MSPKPGNEHCRIDAFGVIAFTLPLAVYLLTLAPTVTFFDSGEFITAISSLGSPHSPGYPLFVNFAKPFTFLPLGDIAFRVNFATAVSASLACLGVYLLVRRLSSGGGPGGEGGERSRSVRLACLSAALFFAFTPRLWLQSNHDKPYPLLTFLAALIFLLLVRWRESYLRGEERPALVYLGALLCGLALGAHQTIVLLVPSFAFLVLATDPGLVLRLREQFLALAFFIVGSSVYLHMPVRAVRNPVLNWGDPSTASRFVWSFLRKGYPMEHVDRDFTLLQQQLAAFDVNREFTLVGIVLLGIGVAANYRRLWAFFAACAVAVITFLAFVVGYQNTPRETVFLTEEFFTPLYMLAAVLIGLGLVALVRIRPPSPELLSGMTPRLRRVADSLSRLMPLVRRLVVLPLLVAVPLLQCLGGYLRNDQHDNYLAYDYAVNTFRSLPRGAVLFTWGDSGAFPLWYLQGVEGMRPDLVLLHVPHLQFDWYLEGYPGLFSDRFRRFAVAGDSPLPDILRRAEEELLPGRPVYIDFSTRYSVDHGEFSLAQEGICYGLRGGASHGGTRVDTTVWGLYSLRGVGGDGTRFLDLDSKKALQIYGYGRMDGGRSLLAAGRVVEGSRELEAAAAMDRDLRGEVRRILDERKVRP